MSQYYKDLMIDIETLGTRSYCAIISIAAIEFDADTGRTGKEFKRNISLQSCLDAGLHVDEDTIKWWLNQNHEVLKELMTEAFPLRVVLREFNKTFDSKVNYWAKSPSFDCERLSDAYQMVGFEEPWKFWELRDVRTLLAMYREMKLPEFKGDKHNPLDDCRYQITCVQKVFEEVKRYKNESNQ